MDQRAKGGTPPTSRTPPPPTTAPPEASTEQDGAAEKARRAEGDRGDAEKRGAGRTAPGDKGAVLELLIQGRCGKAGQRRHHFPPGCPEGNMHVRVGLQAKRTKKPPKILESYVCKPTIRTYQRQGRTETLNVDGDGGVGQRSKASPPPEEATGDELSLLEPGQIDSQRTASALSPPLLSSQSQLLSPSAPAASAPSAAGPDTKPARKVPIKQASKTEVNSNGSCERVKRDKLASVSSQQVPTAGHKPCSPKSGQTAPTLPSTPSLQSPTAVRTDGGSYNIHNGLMPAGSQKGLPNGKASADTLGPNKTAKVKVGKHPSSSTAATRDKDSPQRPPVSGSFHTDHMLSHRSKADSQSSVSFMSKPQCSTTSLPSDPSQKEPSLQPVLDNKRDKEKRAKKEKRKDKKSKRERAEGERVKGASRREDGKKKKKVKDGKIRHGKGKDGKHWDDDTHEAETEKSEKGKAERKRDKLPPESATGKDLNTKTSATEDSNKLDKTFRLANTGGPNESHKAETFKPVKQVDPTGDASKSKEHNVPSRHPSAPPNNTSSSPPCPLPHPARCPTSPVTPSPPEQDSRPLKKRKARRPSWTKLVQRAQRLEIQEPPLESFHNSLPMFPQNTKTSLSNKTTNPQTDESHPIPSAGSPLSSSPLRPPTKPSPPNQSQANSESSSSALKYLVAPARKRGRPRCNTSSSEDPPPRHSPKDIPDEEPSLAYEGAHNPSVPEAGSKLSPSTSQPHSTTPRKRGRPPKRPLPKEPHGGDAPGNSDGRERSRDFYPNRGNRQLKIRRLIGEMKKRKRQRMCELERRERKGRESSTAVSKTTANTLSALSTTFGGPLGPQINVSKRGTIYMGKRRGRKPKAQPVHPVNSHNPPQPSLFANPSDACLFSPAHSHPPLSHPFPSPSLTHSSGAQSPYSEGSFTEQAPSFVFSHPFSLPSPSSSCTSPRPPSSCSSSLSPFVKRSCPCQGRLHFPFHQSSCKLSAAPPPPPLHTPGSPSYLKEATASPRSESHSEETLPSDSGIGTDNSACERAEMRAARGAFKIGQRSAVSACGQRHPVPSLAERPSPVASPLLRHAHPAPGLAAADRHRHRHRRRELDCSSPCPCLCPCPHLDYSRLGLKRPKNKHKKKHQQMHTHDPDFLAELDDLIGQFGEVHIGRRGWVRSGLGQVSDGPGRRPHPSSAHPLRSSIFRINLNGFYSPHPASYPAGTSFSAQPFYPCQPLHCGRRPTRRQCGCPSKYQEAVDDLGFYRGYPTAAPLYPHLHSSFPLPPPHQYATHQPHHQHHAHFLLNPARFRRRRSCLLREGVSGEQVHGEMAGPAGGGPACGCGRNEHKRNKHRRRHSGRDAEEEEEEEEEKEEEAAAREAEEEQAERERMSRLKARSGFTAAPADGARKAAKGSAGSVSPWLRKNANDSSSSAASASLSSPFSMDRLKHAPFTAPGLGSSHLCSFGGGWGGLGQPWLKTGHAGSAGFGLSGSSWRSFTGVGQTAGCGRPDPEEQDNEDVEEDDDDEEEENLQQSEQYRSPAAAYTNLFTSAAMATGGKGLKMGMTGGGPGSADRSWRRKELTWREGRVAGFQGDSARSRGQERSVPAADGATLAKKRGPGRPRKRPLPSPSPPATSGPLPAGRLRHGPPLTNGRGAGGSAAEESDWAPQDKRSRGQKRRRGDSPQRQSFSEDKASDSDSSSSECSGQSDVDVAPLQAATVQWEERADTAPRKKFLRAGLYSDDYKTTDTTEQAQHGATTDGLEYMPGENEYSLLPAPIHVGKYLRLKRIDFQLPYDVMWLWRNNQLHKQPAVPLKRKRLYCRFKEKMARSKHTTDEVSSLFPHLDMDPLTSSERGFVVKHHVFLLRNWELVRERQIRLRIERGGEVEGEDEDERDTRLLPSDGARGEDDSHIKSDQHAGADTGVATSTGTAPNHTQDPSSSHTACPNLTETPRNRTEEGGEEAGKRGGEEVSSREVRRKRLNDLLLTLQHS